MSNAEVPTTKAEEGKPGARLSPNSEGGFFPDPEAIADNFLLAIDQAHEMVNDEEGCFDYCLNVAMIRDGDLRNKIAKRPHAAKMAVKRLPHSHKLFRTFIKMISQDQPLPRRDKKWRKKR